MDKNSSIKQYLSNLGLSDLNLMQKSMLKAYSTGDDIVLLSPTGSGKTLAYLFPLIFDLAERQTAPDGDSNEAPVQAIVLVPSRELALQTEQVFRQIGSPLHAVSCYGGRPAMDEHRTLKGVMPEIVIATPGRMNDHLGKGNIQADTVRVLVIDEFDKCLELGFREEMADVIRKLPSLRRRILLSATDTDEIPKFAGLGKKDLERLNFLDDSAERNSRIEMHLVNSPEKDKLDTLYSLLCSRGVSSSIVFVNYRESVERVGKYLKTKGISAEMFHGGMEQKDREKALYKFSNGSALVFVSTDLASRGLDISSVDNIIHYHLPVNEESFIHRNGRTARFDATGHAFLILGPEETLPEYVPQDIKGYSISSTSQAPEEPLWVTLYIGKGKKDKLSRGDVMGFLCSKGNLRKEQVGRIDVKDHYSFVAVERKCHRQLLKDIAGEKIKGMRTIMEITR